MPDPILKTFGYLTLLGWAGSWSVNLTLDPLLCSQVDHWLRIHDAQGVIDGQSRLPGYPEEIRYILKFALKISVDSRLCNNNYRSKLSIFQVI
jgi:hypothetical protein